MLRKIAITFGMLLLAAPVYAAPDAAAAISSNAAADRFITVGDTVLRVRDEGPRRGPPIILIHGFTFSLETWDAWAADLARDHRVIRYDLSGHGLSGADPAGKYATADREAQLGLLMDKLRIRKATIAGNSLGGMIAWNFAADHPPRVDKLILVDTGAFPINGVTDKPVPVPAPMRAFLTAPSPAVVAFSAKLIYAQPEKVPPATLARLQSNIARNGPALVQHLEQFTLPDPVTKLGAIKAPTLVLWGTEDKFIAPTDARRVGDAIPGARIEMIPHAGHLPQEEAAPETLAIVRDFLGQ